MARRITKKGRGKKGTRRRSRTIRGGVNTRSDNNLYDTFTDNNTINSINSNPFYSTKNRQYIKNLIDSKNYGNIKDYMINIPITENNSTPLIYASELGNKELVEFLLGKRVNVNLTNNDGTTALNMASYKGYSEIVELLLNNNAEIDKTDNSGFTPLMSAIIMRRKLIVNLLLSRGADVETNKDKIINLALNSTQEIRNIIIKP